MKYMQIDIMFEVKTVVRTGVTSQIEEIALTATDQLKSVISKAISMILAENKTSTPNDSDQ